MKIPRLPLTASPSSVGLTFQDISFNSRVDHVSLKGWFLPAKSDSVILIVNGGFQNRVDPLADTLDLSRDLVQKGYNVLLFDLRGRGESSGAGRSLSNIDKDIGGAVDYLNSRGYLDTKIGIIGFCSGAASACIFSSENNVGALVLDGCFTSVSGMVHNQAATRGIPQPAVDVFLPAVQLAARVFYSYQPLNPIDVVNRIQCPIFFIHEQDDDLVLTKDDIALKNKAGDPSDLFWQVNDTTHSRAYPTHPAEYVSRIDDFFRAALRPTTPARPSIP